MLTVAQHLDETLAEVACSDDKSRAKTDWLVRSPEKTSNRVLIRFGENSNDDDRIREYVGNPSWEDSRSARFEENLPLSTPEELKHIAEEIGVQVEPYRAF